jgi:hypothetical protein
MREANSMEGGVKEINYRVVGFAVGKEFIRAWARGLGASEEGSVKIVNCLDTEYLLSLPHNFKGYKKGNFSDQAHSRHLWYCNAARIVGWRNMRHKFPSAISNFIKQEVWPEQEINGATKIAEVGTDAGIPKALGRGNGWNGALVSRRETIYMDPLPSQDSLAEYWGGSTRTAAVRQPQASWPGTKPHKGNER